VVLIAVWLFLKFLKKLRGSNFEWYVKLGPWGELQDRLDSLTSAIVTDRLPPPDTGARVFEETRFTPSPYSRRELNGSAIPLEELESGYVSSRTGTGLGLRAEMGDGIGDGRRTPSPGNSQSGLNSMVGRAQETDEIPRRKPVPRTTFRYGEHLAAEQSQRPPLGHENPRSAWPLPRQQGYDPFSQAPRGSDNVQYLQ
jgi:hypothetical protein